MTALDEVCGALGRVLGWRVEDRNLAEIERVVAARVAALGCADAGEYLRYVVPGSSELAEIARSLAVTETYFLRNPDHFRVLESITRARLSSAGRRLRVLCAGCASGAEAYSVALVLRPLLSDHPDSSVSILGIDLHPDMIAQAQRGAYSAWALRGVPDSVHERAFHRRGREFVVRDELRAMVRFEVRNLMDEDPELWLEGAFDVVFCRNVLMYFERDQARRVVARCARALASDGLLFLGHAESLRDLSSDFHLVHANGTFFYQRKDRVGSASPPSPPPMPRVHTTEPVDPHWHTRIASASRRIESLAARSVRPSASGSASTAMAAATTSAVEPAAPLPGLEQRVLGLMNAERFEDALELLDAARAPGLEPEAWLVIRAAALLARGCVDEAEAAAVRALAVDELDPDAHYILGLVGEHAGRGDDALEQYRIAAYLDPDFALPHLQVGRLARREGRLKEARRELELAARLLPKEHSARISMFGGGFARASLVRLCDSELASCAGEGS